MAKAFSELELLLQFPYKIDQKATLVDVGGHVGSVSKKFAQKGWRVIAFEPEPNNRKELENNLQDFKEITIIPKAVSNEADQLVKFYVSSEHWGIHSLKPFHPTHKPQLVVETVRLDTTLKNLGVTEVNFLKVDVEGADFLVLQGFDFNRMKPELVMCEFADDRSKPNFGCTHHDIAHYMSKLEYTVFVAEWAAIKEYGRKGKKTEPHQFLQCCRYPLDHEPAWGNLIFVLNKVLDKFEDVLFSYLVNLGDSNSQEKNYDESIKFYVNSLAIKKNSASLLHKIGDTFFRKGDIEKASDYYNSALQIDANMPWPYRGLGQVLESQGNYDEAAIAYSKAIQIKPDYETAKTLLIGIQGKPILLNSNHRILAYKDKHKGKRCVIIGNGPSLNKMDLSFLKHEICFGMNRIYLGFEKWGFSPSYYVTVNRLVIEQSAEHILNIPCPKFISNKGIPYLPDREDIIFIHTFPYKGQPFSTNPEEGFNEGSTVTYVALQLAYYMGFETVILIGVDHNFVTQGQPHKEVISQGDDPNHFHPDYFGKGTRWHLPDLETSENHYKIADAHFKANNRQIIDATLDGHCQVFTKKHYKEVFNEYFTIQNLQEKSNEVCTSQDYNYSSYVQLAWSMYEKNDLASMSIFLGKSLDYTPYLPVETILNWVQQFEYLAQKSDKQFDINYLSDSYEWEKLINKVLLTTST